ncbi:MAG: DUF4437 domain-containing protein [Hyphomicrobiales bacterium]
MTIVFGIVTTVTTHAVSSDVIVNTPTSKMQWETTPEGVQFATLEGDRFAEPYMAMVQLPAGLISPAHTKTANMFGIVLSGTMVHEAQNAPADALEVQLPKGSFYKIPAGLPHISKCISAENCVTFLYQDGQFDFLPVPQ